MLQCVNGHVAKKQRDGLQNRYAGVRIPPWPHVSKAPVRFAEGIRRPEYDGSASHEAGSRVREAEPVTESLRGL